ncbi:flagellar biosynthetic protein FliO [Massilia genomosp. 1]|uniref:Flagellar protein n=1 Tax=Massilia genomosp. 1 TaxID=2609280 RepID=A0ABX0MTJ3_9BURK|nr:flagellar biosynthetic protein FliO [Massilia genomosp. 1]NHZ65756.1 flagellar biosynthetic protein FliO [Massilia genomosp. 1]
MTARLLAAVALACSLAPGLVAAQAAGAAAPAASAPLKSVPAAASAPVASVPAASAPLASVPAASVPAAAEAPASVAVLAAPAPAPAPVAALPAAAVPATPGPMAGPSAGNLLQTIFALTLVLALLGAMVWFMKRFGPQAAAGAAQMRTIGALSLGGRERVIVIEVGDQWIVVGASPGRINALATMPRQESAGGPAVLTNGPASGTFAEWLKQTIDKRNGR